MILDRRTALVILAGITATVHGKEAPSEQGAALQLILDPFDAIDVRYRGRRVLVSPNDLLAALDRK